MKGCATMQANELLGAINRLRKAALLAKQIYFAEDHPKNAYITPAMRDLADALRRIDELLGPAP